MLETEEEQLKDKCDYYRRKEDKLRVIKHKIDVIEGSDRFSEEVSEDQRDALVKEVQVDYEKYH